MPCALKNWLFLKADEFKFLNLLDDSIVASRFTGCVHFALEDGYKILLSNTGRGGNDTNFRI